MKNGGIDKAGGNEQTLSWKMPNVEHSMLYKNADNQILILMKKRLKKTLINEIMENISLLFLVLKRVGTFHVVQFYL